MNAMKIKMPDVEDEHFAFYGESLNRIEKVLYKISNEIEKIEDEEERLSRRRIEHFKARIKSPKSVEEKLLKRGYESNLENALTKLYDYAGVRIVCSFLDDIYSIRDTLKEIEGVSIVEEKDYVKYPKPNGYRSYHMILKIDESLTHSISSMYIEIQIRTISQDSWASLEHQLKYKKEIGHSEVIMEELKRCAEEMASTDLTMQTIRDWIDGKIGEDQ